jgi:hypothetical protein
VADLLLLVFFFFFFCLPSRRVVIGCRFFGWLVGDGGPHSLASMGVFDEGSDTKGNVIEGKKRRKKKKDVQR